MWAPRRCILNHARLLFRREHHNVCIVGSGPSAFYVAQYLMKKSESVRVDIVEKLPVPFGLIRYGVAPDHPEVKNVINAFTQVARNPRFQYYGNITVGGDISLRDLCSNYDVVVLAYGACTDRQMDIVGEDLPGVLSAKDLVGWYNGYPNHRTFAPDLDCDTIAIVGMGNVALDVARIFLSSVDRLKKTDIPEAVLEHLSSSRVRRVIIIARRGPLQAAFTLKEFRELCCLGKTEGTSADGFRVEFAPNGIFDEALLSGDDRVKLLSELSRPRRRLIEYMLGAAGVGVMPAQHRDVEASLCCEFRFLRSPVQVIPRRSVLEWMKSPAVDPNASNVAGIDLRVNKLVGPYNEHQRCVPAEIPSLERLECGIVVRSIGYRSVRIDPDLPFDEDRGVIACSDEYGRVPNLLMEDGVDGGALLYASGWAKVGGIGVINNTLADARATAQAILTDLTGKKHLPSRLGFTGVAEILQKKGVRPVTFADWERVDTEEKEAGRNLGKPREKITSLKEILRIAFSEVAKERSGNSF